MGRIPDKVDLTEDNMKKIFSFLVYLNQLFFKLQIKFHSADFNNNAIFINFNYDYSFLKKLDSEDLLSI